MVEQEDCQEEGVQQGEGGQQAGERRPVLRGGKGLIELVCGLWSHLVSELDDSREEVGDEADNRSKAETHSLQK